MSDQDRPGSNPKVSASVLHDSTVTPRDDRRQRGETLRATFPLESHAGWKKPDDRPDVVDILEESNQGRIDRLIPIRYGRMLPSPFTYYRGSAAVMALDLARTPITHVNVQACGDCHLLNFGAFATPERNVAFDINDFDETLPAPWEYDLKRLCVSYVLAARANGLKPKHAAAAAQAVAEAYRLKMAEYARMSILDIWYDRIDWQHVIASTGDADLQKKRERKLNKARKQTGDYYFPKMVEKRGGGYVIKENPPKIYHVDDKEDFIEKTEAALATYADNLQEDKRRLFSRYKFVDAAIKVVGIGSVGTMCAIILLLAPDEEPLFLQLKEARESVLEPYVGKSTFDNCGQRVVEGQRIIQSASDIFLGFTEFDSDKHFYVRQLRDTKIKLVTDFWDPRLMTQMAKVMGEVLAKAHARSGDSSVIAGYLGNDSVFDEAVADFSIVYANQVERDYEAVVAACQSGRIRAEREDDQS